MSTVTQPSQRPHRDWRNMWAFFMGKRCLGCGDAAYVGKYPLCEECSLKFAPYTRAHCSRCGLPFRSENATDVPCSECLITPPPWEEFFCHGMYSGPLRKLILRLKFHGGVELVPLLGNLLQQVYAPVALPDVITSVPLHSERLGQRGFNQSYELLRPIAKQYGARLMPTVVERCIATIPQMELSVDERKKNLRGVFTVPQPELIHGKRVLLGDDIMTTGATLRQVATCLLQAGASAVDVVVLARTGKPD